jgi:hypothetical protein
MKILIAALILISSCPVLAASAADVSNERIQVSGAELELHWQLDCRAMLDAYNNRIVSDTAPENEDFTIDVLRELASVAQKCSFIYNQKGTGREVACPDYQSVSDILQGLVSSEDATKPSGLEVVKCRESKN